MVNFAFVEERWEQDFAGNAAPIRLANPIASQLSVMRSSLIAGLVGNLVTNRNRQVARVRVFETGRCFARSSEGAPVDGFDQPVMLAALAAGPAVAEQWAVPTRAVDFYDVKSDLEALLAPARAEFVPCEHPALHPGRCASVRLGGKEVGVVGEIHPSWVQRYELGGAPVVFELRMDALLDARLPAYRAISRQPAVVRDLALTIDQAVRVADVLEALNSVAEPIVRSIELFDVYQGKGIAEEKKSLAFRVLMQDTQRTLEDAEVERAVSLLVKAAEIRFGAKLRG